MQFHVCADSIEFARQLINLGNKAAAKAGPFSGYYQPAFQLGLDMLQRMRYYPEIVSVLIAEDQVMKALDFAIQNDVTGIRVRSLVENAE